MSTSLPSLPPSAAEHLAAFEDPAILGASRQIAIASDLLASLVQEHHGSPAEVVRDLRAVAAYLIDRRGASTQAIPNALAQLLADSAAWDQLSHDEFRNQALAAIRGYTARTQRDRDRVTAVGVTVVAKARRILAYDYSSSVVAILRERGVTHTPTTVVVPEARSLNGGRRIAEDLISTGVMLEFVLDAAISSLLRTCDVALMGAETVGADGSCYNTTGSLGVALACDYWRVPLFVPTTLIKIDTRTLTGYRRPMPPLHDDRLEDLTHGWPSTLRARVRVASPDLDQVPARLITGYITEAGLLPPAAVFNYAVRLAEELSNV